MVFHLVAGFVLAQSLLQAGAGDPNPEQQGVFFYLFARHEPVHFAILVVVGAVLLPFIVGARGVPRLNLTGRWTVGWPVVVLLGCAVLVLAALGGKFVLHNYPLAMDEFAPTFQAQIFAAGQFKAVIPNEWRDFVEPLTPIFIGTGSERDSWTSMYLPVAAAIRALFVVVGAPDLTNPVLAGLTMPIMWLAARRLWPGESTTPWVPTVLLAVSPQFLFTSMTAYAMPAHLLFNMTWLYLYLVGSRGALALAGLVGVLAMGLHQPHVHALFVAPFLVRLVLSRRWQAATFFSAVYLLGAALWLAWWLRFNPAVGAVAGIVYSLPGSFQLLLQPMNAGLLLSWKPIAMSLLVVVGLLRWRAMSSLMRDLVIGMILTLGFYVFVNFEQGHGWGYRYAYGVLGNIALLAGHGWMVLGDEWKRSRGPAFLGLAVLIALVVQMPIRALQAELFVRPFADSMALVRSLPADVALVRRNDAWYAQDLVRNDPWLRNTPKVMFEHKLTGSQIAALRAMGSVRRVEAEELGRFGMVARRSSGT